MTATVNGQAYQVRRLVAMNGGALLVHPDGREEWINNVEGPIACEDDYEHPDNHAGPADPDHCQL